jgi:hypothetical protein
VLRISLTNSKTPIKLLPTNKQAPPVPCAHLGDEAVALVALDLAEVGAGPAVDHDLVEHLEHLPRDGDPPPEDLTPQPHAQRDVHPLHRAVPVDQRQQVRPVLRILQIGPHTTSRAGQLGRGLARGTG